MCQNLVVARSQTSAYMYMKKRRKIRAAVSPSLEILHGISY